jgi:hypothetical protein
MITTKEEYHKALRRLDELCTKENLSVKETIELDKELVIDIQLYEDFLFREYLDENFLTYKN